MKTLINPFCFSSRLALPGRLVVARTEANPGGQAVRGAEDAHVAADLDQQHGCTDEIGRPGKVCSTGQRIVLARQFGEQTGVETGDARFEFLDMPQQFVKNEHVTRGQFALQGIVQFLAAAVVLRSLANDSLQRAQTGLLVFSRTGRCLYENGPARAFLAAHHHRRCLQRGAGANQRCDPGSARKPFVSAGCPGQQRVCCAPSRWTMLRQTRSAVAASQCLAGLLARARGRHARRGHRCSAALLRTHGPGSSAGPVCLSPRQAEITAWALRGLSNSEIAQQISVGDQTVRDHFQEIYSRIGVHSRTELLATVLGTIGSVPPARGVRGG
jgi:DNA-binding CsgD family transcriptional regulator